MSNQLPLFDPHNALAAADSRYSAVRLPGAEIGVPAWTTDPSPPTGAQLRDQGMASVAAHNEAWRFRQRCFGARICLENGVVWSDEMMYGDAPNHPNAWGTVLVMPYFRGTGQFRSSQRPSRHAGRIEGKVLTERGREELLDA